MFPVQWSPTWNFPLSGDVRQDIDPIFGLEIKGVPEIEREVVTSVASYGKQLGKITEALLVLAKATKTDLPEIAELAEEVEAAKLRAKDALRARAEEALARLEAVDPEGHARLLGR